MQVRIWHWQKQGVSDRPAELVMGHYGLMVQWKHLEGERGSMVVESVQLRCDDGKPAGEVWSFSPPWAIFALLRDGEDASPVFRVPIGDLALSV